MATRSARDNKALNARHAETLKAMLRRPENKTCADCKKNDPRWASINLGCFMCIRCSGIHRSMGVHITRIKSIDLDTWTPDQVANVQRWGNRRANAYWEAHLKPGHMPPDHKIESFIRSKYECRRWAPEGPLPEPETLDQGSADVGAEVTAPAPSGHSNPKASAPRRPSVGVTLSKASAAPAVASSISLLDAPPSSDQAALGSNRLNSSNPSSVKPGSANNDSGNGLFDLDFSPAAASQAASATAPAARKDVKNDILSLFSVKPVTRAHPVQNSAQSVDGVNVNGPSDQFGGLNFSATNVPTQHLGANNTWGSFGGLTASATASDAQVGAFGFGAGGKPAAVTQGNLFGGSANPWVVPSGDTPLSSDPFGSFADGTHGATNNGQSSKDAFSDIWS